MNMLAKVKHSICFSCQHFSTVYRRCSPGYINPVSVREAQRKRRLGTIDKITPICPMNALRHVNTDKTCDEIIMEHAHRVGHDRAVKDTYRIRRAANS
jgi:hypothetical protein